MESVPRHRASYKFPSFSSRSTHHRADHHLHLSLPLSFIFPRQCATVHKRCAASWSRVHLSERQRQASAAAAATTMEWPVAAARDGQAPRQQLPPGFRFHPTDEELVVQYLRRKALSRPLPAAVIPVVHDGARRDPWDLPGARDGEAYFFSLRRAPARRRRACSSGYWKATGKAKPVFLPGPGCGGKRYLVGVKTALAFHHAEEPSRTAWVMHEYRLAVPEQGKNATHGCAVHPGEWVVCRIFLKNSSTRRSSRDTAGETPGNLASCAAPARDRGTGQLRLSSSSSSSSCVTGVTEVSDQDEVNSGQ